MAARVLHRRHGVRHSTQPMRFTKLALALLLATCAWSAAAPASAASRPLPPLTPAKHDALSRALEQGRLTESQYALERARSLFTLDRVRAEFGHVAPANPHAATFILRDLLARTRFLSGSEHAEAKAILSRPDGAPTFLGEPSWDFDAVPTSFCEGGGRPLCFHWDDNPTNRDSPPPADTNPANGIPDQIDDTIAVLDNVWDTETAGLGYREPLDDSATTLNDGGGPQLDIYIADIGSIGLFGYCTSDDPHAYEFSAPWAVSAYCVLDDDYRQGQYGIGQTPLEYLQVTAAHEFFHAVQFAYDWFEDYALMEGSAMWMEGQVYPDCHRPDQLPRPQRARPAGRPARHRRRWLRVRRVALLALPDGEGLLGRPDDHPRDLGTGRRRALACIRRPVLLPGRTERARLAWPRLPQHVRAIRLDERPARLRGSGLRLPGGSARSDVQLRPLPALDGLGGAETGPPLHALLSLPSAGGRLGGEASPPRRPSLGRRRTPRQLRSSMRRAARRRSTRSGSTAEARAT